MSSIRRFDIDEGSQPRGWWHERDDPDGDYVTYADHTEVVARLTTQLSAAEKLRSAIGKYMSQEVGGSTGPATPHWLDMVNAIAAFDAAKEAKR